MKLKEERTVRAAQELFPRKQNASLTLRLSILVRFLSHLQPFTETQQVPSGSSFHNTAATSNAQAAAHDNPPMNVQGNEDGTMQSDALKAFENSEGEEDYDKMDSDQSSDAVQSYGSAESPKSPKSNESNESTWEDLG